MEFKSLPAQKDNGVFMTISNVTTLERREHQRFVYKAEHRPVFDCRTRYFKVINISTGGIKIELLGQSHQSPFSGVALSGTLYLANGSRLEISGTIVWIIGDHLGLKLHTPLDAELIKTERPYFLQ
jgi:hypothetical protein